MVAHPHPMVGCAMTPPLSQGLSASPHARPIPGTPAVPAVFRWLTPSESLRSGRACVAAVVPSFAYAKAAPILTPYPQPCSKVSAALWGPRNWPRLRLGACRYAPGGGVASKRGCILLAQNTTTRTPRRARCKAGNLKYECPIRIQMRIPNAFRTTKPNSQYRMRKPQSQISKTEIRIVSLL